jgi:hypothetical protein
MSRNFARIAAATALVLAATSAAQAELIYGLTTTDGAIGSGLTSFDSATPGTQTALVPITGAVNLRGIDFRPATGQLYGIGYTTATTTAQLYTINTTTGVASAVGAPLVLPTLGASTRISIDWNPVVDRLRVVSGAGGNLRLAPDGTLAGTDTALTYAAGDIGTGAPLVSGIAYTNNVAGATSTTLYASEFIFDAIATVGSVGGTPESPNTGLLHTVGRTEPPISQFAAATGFDISGATGVAYLMTDEADSATSLPELYSINLATGTATSIADEFGPAGRFMLDLSVVTAVPEPTTLSIAAAGLLLARRRR